MTKKKAQKNTIITKIAVSTFIAIFSLASAFAGTYAWFSSMSSVSVSGGSVKVNTISSGASIASINLIKFEYGLDQFGDIDYLDPQLGKVVRYRYDDSKSEFGEDVYYCTGCDKTYGESELDLEIGCPENNAHTLDDNIYYCVECESVKRISQASDIDTISGVHKCHTNNSHTLLPISNSYYCVECSQVYHIEDLDKHYMCHENHSHVLEQDWFYCEECGDIKCASNPSDLDMIDEDYKCHVNNNHTLVDNRWKSVSLMNVYDPVEKEIKGSSFNLRDLHCNAIYEITFDATGTFDLSVIANKLTRELDSDEDVLFTSCGDFDIFTEVDLIKNVGFKPETSDPAYYPQYRDSSDPLNKVEDIFHRISYYATNSPHTNFYSGGYPNGETNTLVHKPIVNSGESPSANETEIPIVFNPVTNAYTIYINVNYADSRLNNFRERIDSGNNVIAVYDFSFSCNFS